MVHSRVRSRLAHSTAKFSTRHGCNGRPRFRLPDIRRKSIIQSKHGSILHIPRRWIPFRSYVDLGLIDEDDNHEIRKTPIEEIICRMNEIISPY